VLRNQKAMASLGMMYPARGGLDLTQMKGVLSEVRGLHPLGCLYSILNVATSCENLVRFGRVTPEFRLLIFELV